MRQRTLLVSIFTVCLVVALLIFGIGIFVKSTGIRFVQAIFSPVQTSVLSLFHHSSTGDVAKLKEENAKLSQEIANLQGIAADNKALRDQFQTTNPLPQSLLPASVIGMPDFLPGVTIPDSLIVSVGTANNVSTGQAVVYKNNLLGTIQTTHAYFSQVQLISDSGVSFAAKTAKTGALGIVKGLGNGQVELDNVVLSDTLEVGDMVVTNPDTAENGKGFPSGLVIGKITTIDKKPSALFQKAHIALLTDITRLPEVFILVEP